MLCINFSRKKFPIKYKKGEYLKKINCNAILPNTYLIYVQNKLINEKKSKRQVKSLKSSELFKIKKILLILTMKDLK